MLYGNKVLCFIDVKAPSVRAAVAVWPEVKSSKNVMSRMELSTLRLYLWFFSRSQIDIVMPRIQTCSELEDLAQGTGICRKDANGTFNFTATLSMRAHRHRRCPEMFNKWSFVLNAA